MFLNLSRVIEKIHLLTEVSQQKFGDVYREIEKISSKYFHDLEGKVKIPSYALYNLFAHHV